MRLKRVTYVLGICLVTWVAVVYLTVIIKPGTIMKQDVELNNQLAELEDMIFKQSKLHNQMIYDAQKYLESKRHANTPARPEEIRKFKTYGGTVIPVLVLACNRISVSRCLDQLIQYRPNPDQFPIIVSQVKSLWKELRNI